MTCSPDGMRRLELLQALSWNNGSKILFWVFDGVAGLPHPELGLTELEVADIPFMDAFAASASCGLHEPFGAGITTGSGLAHMALFGYPTHSFALPRGVLEVLGARTHWVDGRQYGALELGPYDLAIRGNFARLVLKDDIYVVANRRANKVSTARSDELCAQLSCAIDVPGVKLHWFPGRQHRFALVLHAQGLHADVQDTDPLRSGLAPLPPLARSHSALYTEQILRDVIAQVNAVLADQDDADTILLRGAGMQPDIPTLQELYTLRGVALAAYPMYRGVAKLVGMDVVPLEDDSMQTLLDTLTYLYREDAHDLFFVHVKNTDSLAHQGAFDKKAAFLSSCDVYFERARALGFDVVVLTGDHCTPSTMAEHSWHQVPIALAAKNAFTGGASAFSERECRKGMLGVHHACDVMGLILAHAGRLKTHGA